MKAMVRRLRWPLFLVRLLVNALTPDPKSQDVKGFPTIKLFPRGKYLPPMLYDQERTTGALYNYAARRVPKAFTSLNKISDVKAWVEKVCLFFSLFTDGTFSQAS